VRTYSHSSLFCNKGPSILPVHCRSCWSIAVPAYYHSSRAYVDKPQLDPTRSTIISTADTHTQLTYATIPYKSSPSSSKHPCTPITSLQIDHPLTALETIFHHHTRAFTPPCPNAPPKIFAPKSRPSRNPSKLCLTPSPKSSGPKSPSSKHPSKTCPTSSQNSSKRANFSQERAVPFSRLFKATQERTCGGFNGTSDSKS
jgi:hypothetical protein